MNEQGVMKLSLRLISDTVGNEGLLGSKHGSTASGVTFV